MAKSKSYQSGLLESLKDPTEAVEYLNAALEDGEPEVFLLALRNVVDSYGGMGKLAASTSLNRENLYRMLSTKGNPEFFSLSTVLDAIGFRLAVEPKIAARSKTKSGVAKLVLHVNAAQVKEPGAKYDLAADSGSGAKSLISLRTSDGKEVGTLDFDYNVGALILQVTGDIPVKRVQEAEIQTRDGKILSGEVSVEGENR
ncbi:MAG: putative addiction module antidote protein, partial [Deltaproteobacteria bacterium]|nr:putative addiction module antidote protein [Deltaproteobacteria bacterium]